MEENQTLNGYLAQYLQEEPSAASAAEVFSRIFGASLGETPISAISDALISRSFEAAELQSSSRDDLFSAMTFLRLLLGYIARVSGVSVPDLKLPQSFLSFSGLSDQNAAFLLSQIVKKPSRAAFCLWLLLRTDIPVFAVLRLTSSQISLEGNLLTVTYDSRTRNLKKAPKPADLRIVSLSLDEASAAFWQEGFEPYRNSSFVLASGDFRPGNRAKLQKALDRFAAEGGFSSLTLKMLQEFVWDEEEKSSDDFTDDAGFDRIAASDRELSDFPTPDVAALSSLLSKLPIPVQEHSRRVRQISSFILEFIRGEDWFLDLELDEFKVLTAVYLHDIGKTALDLENLYPTRSGREANNKYRAHVAEGLAALQATTATELSFYPAQSFAGLLRDAIADHHESPDGKGFPDGKKEISFIGSLTAVADSLDHVLFTGEETVPSIPDLLGDFFASAGTKLDARLLTVLNENKNKFVEFLAELCSYYGEKRKWDAYGMRFVFRPYRTSGGDTLAYRAQLFLNDPYYGLIDSALVLPLMEENPQYSTFVRLEIKRLCRLIFEKNEQGTKLPPILLKIAVREPLRPKFFEELFKIFVSNNIRYHQIVFAIDEADAIGNDVNMPEIAEKFRLIGAQVALLHFGGATSLFPSIDRINPDFIVMRSEYIDAADVPMRLQFLRNVTETCHKIGTKVLMPKPIRTDVAQALRETPISAFGTDYETDALSEESFLAL